MRCLLILLLLSISVRGLEAATISIGARIDLPEPGTFVVPIEVADAIDLTEWTFGLSYDPSVVEINEGCDLSGLDPYCSFLTGPITEGDFFASGAPFNLIVPGVIERDPATNAQTGHLFGVQGIYGGFGPLPSGNGTLAYVQFKVIGTGESRITLDGATPVPEPGTAALLTLGLITAARRRLLGCRQRER